MPLSNRKKFDAPRPVAPSPKKKESSFSSQPVSKAGAVRAREQKSGCLGAVMMFVFLFCFALALAFFCWMAASDALSLNKESFTATVTLPVEQFSRQTVSVTEEDGSEGTKTITRINSGYLSEALKEAGLINYKWLFNLYCSISDADTKVDPGEYDLKSSYDYRALIQNMRQGIGGMKTVDVTIPEGFTMQEIFQRFSEKKVASYDSLLNAATDEIFKYDFISEPGESGPSRLEGFLFPDTYQFYVGMEAPSAINKLLSNFYNKFTQDMTNRAAELGYSVRDIVTIASIIEKESKLDEDRAYVASVIYNRLDSGMTLGMDTTVLYLFPEHEGEPTQEMLDTDSPYNTHIYGGLPPTPICNPGIESMMAALYPAESEYYYFFADIESGKLNFFTNYNDFDAYVQSHR